MNKLNRHHTATALGAIAGLALAGATTQAAIVNFQGGNLAGDPNWLNEDGVTYARPSTGDTGMITTSGTLNIGNTLGAWMTGDPVLIIDNGAVITCGGDWGHVNVLSSTVNNGTINAGDDIFANGSTMTFNAGSATDVNDDFEANGTSILNINGGTHETGDVFGAQSSSTTSFGTVNLTGGSITAGQFRVEADGTIPGVFNLLPGNAILSGGGDASLLDGTMTVSSAWTGSWTITGLSGTDWETAVTAGNWTLDGSTVDATIFGGNFVVTNSGTTLALVPEPSAALLGALGLLGLLRRRRK